MSRSIDDIFSKPLPADYVPMKVALFNASNEEKTRLMLRLPLDIQYDFFYSLCEKFIKSGLTFDNLNWIDRYLVETTASLEDKSSSIRKQPIIDLTEYILKVKNVLMEHKARQDPNNMTELLEILTKTLTNISQSELNETEQGKFERYMNTSNKKSSLKEKITYLKSRTEETTGVLYRALQAEVEQLEMEEKATHTKIPAFHDISHLTGLAPTRNLGTLTTAANQRRRVFFGEEKIIEKISEYKATKAAAGNKIFTPFNVDNTKEALAVILCGKADANAEDIQWLRNYLTNLQKTKGSVAAWHMILDLRMQILYPAQTSEGLVAMEKMLASLQQTIQPSPSHFGFLKRSAQSTQILQTLEEKMLDHFSARVAKCINMHELSYIAKEFSQSGHGAILATHPKHKGQYEKIIERKSHIIHYHEQISVEKLGYDAEMVKEPESSPSSTRSNISSATSIDSDSSSEEEDDSHSPKM